MTDTYCGRVCSCGGACCLSAHVPHTIHACRDPHCLACHGGAVHAAAMLARRREIAARAVALIRAEMDAYAEGLDDE